MSADQVSTTTQGSDFDKDEAAHLQQNVEVGALAVLWADHFRHLTTLGVAGAGGVLILIQAHLIELQGRWWLSLALFVASAIASMYGQIAVVDEATQGQPPGKRPRLMRYIALATLGAAGGAALGTLTHL